MNVGEVSGVAVNSKGDVAIFTRSNSAGGPAYGATASQVLLFDKTGKFLREIGKGLYAWSYAHAVRFDKDDNLWAIDKGSDMIVRINPEGHVTMVFGRKKEASDKAEPWERVNPPRPPVPGQFRQPTDVAFDTEGNIYISDGYINSRVAKFTKDGDWVASHRRTGPRQARRTEHAAHDRQRRQRETSTSATAATAGSRSSIRRRTSSSARSRSTCRCRRTRSRGWAPTASRAEAAGAARAARRGPSASRRPTLGHSSSSTARTRFQGASTSFPSTARSSAGSASRGTRPSSSAGSTKSPARPRTRSTSRSC